MIHIKKSPNSHSVFHKSMLSFTACYLLTAVFLRAHIPAGKGISSNPLTAYSCVQKCDRLKLEGHVGNTDCMGLFNMSLIYASFIQALYHTHVTQTLETFTHYVSCHFMNV